MKLLIKVEIKKIFKTLDAPLFYSASDALIDDGFS